MRILIVSPRAAALCQLFPQSGNNFNLCATLLQMREAMLSSAPHLVLLDEDIDTGNAVAILANIKTMVPSSTYLTIMTRQVELSEICQRMVTDAFIRPEADAEVVSAVLVAYSKRKSYLSARILNSLIFVLPLQEKLSKRERQILDMIAKRLSSKEIAVSLNLSEETVQNHRKAIKNKLGLRGGKTTLLSYTKLCDLVEQIGEEE